MTSLVHPEAQGDFLRERKRLRDARIKWIDENEMPTAMEVRDKAGNLVKTPFMIGKMDYGKADNIEEANAEYVARYGDTYEGARASFLPENLTLEQSAVTEQLDKVITIANELSGIPTTDAEGNEVSFSAKSDHPPIREGETYEQWFTRVSNSYTKKGEDPVEAGDAGADPDRVRRPAGDDTGDGGPPHGEGASSSSHAGGAGDMAGGAVADYTVEGRIFFIPLTPGVKRFNVGSDSTSDLADEPATDAASAEPGGPPRR